MGFGDWVSSVGHGIVQGIDHAGNAVGHAVGSAAGAGYTLVTGDKAGGQQLENSIDGVSDAVFFDGTVKGTNPALLHKYFNDGPGTQSYGLADSTLKSLNSKLGDIATSVQNATTIVGQGWQGQASQAALQDIGTTHTAATALAQRASAKQSAYSGQIQVFDSTKHTMVKVPDNPPPPNNPLMMDPISTASGAVDAAGYQAGAKANQQAYTAYQPPTQTHLASIPQGSTAITTGQGNPDQGPTQPGGPGITEPGGYNPSFGQQSPRGRSSTGQQPNNRAQHFTQPNIGPGGTQQGGSTGTPGGPGGAPGSQPPTFPGGSSTGLAGYQAPPAGSSGFPTPGSYDSSFGPGSGRGGADGGYGSGSVFARGGFGGSGSGFGGAGGAASGRGGVPGSGPGAGAAAGAEGGVAGRGGVAGARGAAGAGGAGQMGAGGKGGKREEDKEHKTAAYLINEENGTEITGELPPSLPAGGVIG
jgi:PPE family